jgi:NADH-quinone oxidoreductase subunit F
MDFDALAARGSALGTASVIVMDDTADMVQVSHRLMQFYQNESCGKCTPCREGTRWVVQMLERMLAGAGTFEDLKVIVDVCKSMEATSFCPLAPGASFPIVSAIEEFRSDFEEHILRNPNPNEQPKMRIVYPYA